MYFCNRQIISEWQETSEGIIGVEESTPITIPEAEMSRLYLKLETGGGVTLVLHDEFHKQLFSLWLDNAFSSSRPIALTLLPGKTYILELARHRARPDARGSVEYSIQYRK